MLLLLFSSFRTRRAGQRWLAYFRWHTWLAQSKSKADDVDFRSSLRPVHFQLLVPRPDIRFMIPLSLELKADHWLNIVAPITDGRLLPRAVLDWGTERAPSGFGWTKCFIAGWQLPEINEFISFTKWRSLRSPRCSRFSRIRSRSARVSCGTS